MRSSRRMAHVLSIAEGVAPRGATPCCRRRADQNEQPKLCSDALIASMVCLQVASIADLADGFLAMSTQVLRVWSSCVLNIARCASGILEVTQVSYLVRKSSQDATPVLCACAAVMPASRARPASGSTRRQFAFEPATIFDVA